MSMMARKRDRAREGSRTRSEGRASVFVRLNRGRTTRVMQLKKRSALQFDDRSAGDGIREEEGLCDVVSGDEGGGDGSFGFAGRDLEARGGSLGRRDARRKPVRDGVWLCRGVSGEARIDAAEISLSAVLGAFFFCSNSRGVAVLGSGPHDLRQRAEGRHHVQHDQQHRHRDDRHRDRTVHRAY